jgi:thiol-disulfide isomerase/thioredoxin
VAILKSLALILFASLLPAAATAVEVGDRLPAISLSNPDGDAFELNLESDDVVAVEFWASWCQACRQMLPVLAQLAEDRGADGFRAIAVNIDRSRSAADEYLQSMPAGRREALKVLFDPGGAAMAQLGPPGLPALYVIERGTVRLVQGGWKADGEQRLRRVVDTLLARHEQDRGDAACEPSACSR